MNRPFKRPAKKSVALGLIYLTIFAMPASMPTMAAENSLRDALRTQVFAEATKALADANAVRASVLTPNTYKEAGEIYERAERAFDDGADVDRVRKILEESTALFNQAAEMAPTVETFVGPAFQARADAQEARAQERAPELWLDAETQLYEATSRAEKGRESRVARYADKAEVLFRDAELEAIEISLFTEIENEIRNAKKLDADDWAPQSYQAASELLRQARTVLAANRYDTDQPRNLANQAMHQALHAQYVATLANDIDDNRTSLEAVLLAWQQTLAPLGDLLDVPMYFDNGPEEATGQLTAAVTRQVEQNNLLTQQMGTTRQRVRLLQEELLTAQAELEDREAAKARLDRRIAQQEQQELTVAQVERSFRKNEAEVVRAEGRLIIRLVGLGFTSGSAEVEPRHEPVLQKLIAAIAEFPNTPITIEGHTDSYGADADNLRLSVRRAESVAAYLQAKPEINAQQLSAVGYGETRPIANNETADGRWKNRRIDVVVYPSWWTASSGAGR
ncbi:MAG: OmpA family protein [Pseudomonadota bacterium]